MKLAAEMSFFDVLYLFSIFMFSLFACLMYNSFLLDISKINLRRKIGNNRFM